MTPQEMLRLLRESDDDDRQPALPLPEAQVEELRHLADAYWVALKDGHRFSPGALVTPRPGRGLHGCGLPYLVLEVRKAEPSFVGNPASNAFGGRYDIRVASLGNDGESYVAHWAESWQLELWEMKS